MISIALALVLILGINAVFKYTTTAVGQGQAINAATRDSRAAQTVFNNDFAAIVPNGPNPTDSACIILRSCAIPAFRDRADQLSDKDGKPLTTDLDGNGTEGDPAVPGEITSPATYNFRNHRTDVFSFFARNLFPRQTGNPGTYVDNMSSQEAWIWYGHLWLPTNDSSTTAKQFPSGPTGTFPGADLTSSTNPNNYYGSQFVLGRVAMLLREPVGGFINDNGGASQYFVTNYTFYPLNPIDLFPLSSASVTSSINETYQPYGSSPTYALSDSRLDIAATTISKFKGKLTNYIANPANTAAPANQWWDMMMDGNPNAANPNTRFKCNPFVSKPLTSAAMAQASPYFLPGCTQFIVEYAGDFLTQDNDPSHTIANYPLPRTAAMPTRYGEITALAGDGQLDFTIDVNGVKQIKWYGMPRNTSGASTTSWANGDVVPLRDWLEFDAWNPASPNRRLILGAPGTYAAPFEQLPLPPDHPNYTNTTGAGMAVIDAANGYTCAWGPNDTPPSLIRITITLTDSSGRLPDGLTYQYVFQVPPQ